MRARVNGWFVLGSLAALGCSYLVLGCGKNADDPTTKGAAGAPATPSIALRPDSSASTINPSFLAAPFREAVLFEPPEGEQRPPDKTCAGKNVAALFEQVAGQEGVPGLWDKIALRGADGKPLRYSAEVATDLGTIEIELYTEAAPNHVRNFIALAQAGYYAGLPFHRTLNGKVEGQTVAYLEGGCPLGTGEFGYGSIGYWLKPEISAAVTHEEGTVGAPHGETAESAACKFYISLTKAPGMDGASTIFGKVTKGLDIAHTINKRPVVEDGALSDRPKEPVLIRAVTIHSGGTSPAIVARNP